METIAAEKKSHARTFWSIGAAVVAMLIFAGWWGIHSLSAIAHERVQRALKEDFASDVDLQDFRIKLFPRVGIEGQGLTLRYKGRTDLPPLIRIRSFSGATSLIGLLSRPVHIRNLRMEGLQITVPPAPERHQGGGAIGVHESQKPKRFVIDNLVADGTALTVLPKTPEKEPLKWDIRRLTLSGAGPDSVMSFNATLRNAKPPGDIHAVGQFGPWQKDDVGGTPLSANYTFRDADLSVFRGIAGILSSQGNFHGALERIEVDGTTDVPNFTVKVSGNPVDLKTQFHAIVDGTDGNTWLQPVNAQFGRSSVVAQGSVAGAKGSKKTVTLDVHVADARVEDMLRLGVKGGEPVMTGAIGFHAKLVIPPGDVDVVQKMKLAGGFEIQSAHFTKTNIQEKVNKLSHSAKGEPRAPETGMVASNFNGQFTLDRGTISFRGLAFDAPGIHVALTGDYGLQDEHLNFQGTAALQAKLSQTTTGFKSFLLKALDPFFEKKNAGAVVPFKITGTREHPSFRP